MVFPPPPQYPPCPPNRKCNGSLYLSRTPRGLFIPPYRTQGFHASPEYRPVSCLEISKSCVWLPPAPRVVSLLDFLLPSPCVAAVRCVSLPTNIRTHVPLHPHNFSFVGPLVRTGRIFAFLLYGEVAFPFFYLGQASVCCQTVTQCEISRPWAVCCVVW